MKLNVKLTTSGTLDLFINNSPWLTNAVTRLDWRRPGREDWETSIASLAVKSTKADDSIEADCHFAEVATLRLRLRRIDVHTWEISGQLCNTGATPIELARCHYLHGELVATAALLAPSAHVGSCRFFKRGDALPPVKQETETLWGSMNVVWPRLADPIHTQSDWALALDTGILASSWDAPGLHFGFTAPIGAFGEIGLHTTANTATCFAGLLLDGVRLDPGQERCLDSLRIRAGDWQESLRLWAGATATAVGVKAVRPPMVGYCSWYQQSIGVLPADVERASREFAAWPTPSGGRTIQLDDGFEVMPGDWGPNARFAASWQDLPHRIETTGSIPGLWLAPHAIFHRHPICVEHPDWLQRMPDGSHAVSFSNWGYCARADWQWGDVSEPTYFLDPDHPGARAFMFDIVASAVRAGWKYLKLDFTYAVSTARRPYNPRKTRMETLRDMYQLFREAAGPDILICACIGEMGRYALGFADTARLGGDIGGDWNSIRRNLPDTLIRMSTNGTWWNGDPDVFYMRRENVSMSAAEAWCLTGTLGMIGGAFLTSDFASQWIPDAQQQVREFWNSAGPQIPRDFHVAYSADGIPQAIRFSYGPEAVVPHCVVVYNWSNEPATVRLPLTALRFPPAASLHLPPPVAGQIPAKLEDQSLLIGPIPPHSLRIQKFARA